MPVFPSSATIKVEIGFSNSWAVTSPTWTDVSAYCSGIQIELGRSPEDPYRWMIGRATVELVNHTSRYDPWNPSGTFPQPNAPLRITCVRGVEEDVLFRGSIPPRTGWHVRSTSYKESVVTVQAQDLLGILGGAHLPERVAAGGYQMVDDRVTAVLDAVGVPNAWRDLDSSDVPLIESTWGVNALAHLAECVMAEGTTAAFYVRKDGTVTFDNKHSAVPDLGPVRITSTQRQFNLADASDARFQTGDRTWVTMFNSWAADNGTFTYSDTDATSVNAYGSSTYDGSLLAASTTDVIAWVDNGLLLWAGNEFDWAAITVNASTDAATLDACAETDLRDHVEVKLYPSGLGAEYASEASVVGIVHRITPGGWLTTFRLEGTSRIDDALAAMDFAYADGGVNANGAYEAAP